ncbi:MAG: MFS transporter [Lachnospiraceae bacterium]|nr:MFS transporter [Candidatus Hippenecus merdae]
MNNRKRTGFFYGWIIVICCTLSVCASSLLSTGMSTNLANLRLVLGFTGTQTSMILTVRSIAAFVVALFADKYFGLLGVKKGMIVAMIAGVVSFFIFSVAGLNLALYYVAAVVAGVAYSYGMMMPSSMLLKKWFNQSRGTAISLAGCGTGLVSIIFAPLVQSTVDRFGLKASFYLQGGFIALVAVILAVLVVEDPAQKGLEPYGGRDFVAVGRAKKGDSSLSKKSVLLLAFATMLVGFTSSPASAHYSVTFTTEGFDAMTVAKIISIYGVVLVASKFIFGRVVDKIGARKSTVIYGTLCTLAILMIFLTRFFRSVTWVTVTMVVVAVGVVIQTLGYPNWVSDLDSKNYDHTLVRCQQGYQLGALVGSPLPGLIADATGTYTWAYLMFAVCTLIYVLIVLGIYASRKK